MNYNFGISSMVYYQERIESLLPYLYDWKIGIIEIKPHIGHFEFQDSKSIEKFKKRSNHLNISVKAVHMPVNGVDISHLEEYDRIKSIREVEKTVLTAYKLGAEMVIVHPGGICNNLAVRKKKLEQCLHSLKEIVKFCEQWNIKLALENTPPGSLGDDWEEIRVILDKISSNYLGICLDTGHYLLYQHCFIGEEFDLEKKPIDWQKNLLHVHIHDNDGKRDLHLLPGEGCYPWATLVTHLKKIKYHGSLIVEPQEQRQLPLFLGKVKQVFEKLKTINS